MGSIPSNNFKSSKIHLDVQNGTNDIHEITSGGHEPTTRTDISYTQVQVQTLEQKNKYTRNKSTGIELNISNIGKVGKISFRNYQNLLYIDCSNNLITCLSYLPPNLQHINCSYNRLSHLALPSNVQVVICSNNQITHITFGSNSNNLYELDCANNKIEALDNLSENLLKLNCSNNNIRRFKKLPEYLDHFNCSHNFITELIDLPEGITILDCSNNMIITLHIPKYLKILNCAFNNLKILENISVRIEEIYCTDNMIGLIDDSKILSYLRILYCGNNCLRKINFLTFPVLEIVDCSYNQLEELIDLPLGLREVTCNDNMIKFITDVNGSKPDYWEYLYDGFEGLEQIEITK